MRGRFLVLVRLVGCWRTRWQRAAGTDGVPSSPEWPPPAAARVTRRRAVPRGGPDRPLRPPGRRPRGGSSDARPPRDRRAAPPRALPPPLCHGPPPGGASGRACPPAAAPTRWGCRGGRSRARGAAARRAARRVGGSRGTRGAPAQEHKAKLIGRHLSPDHRQDQLGRQYQPNRHCYQQGGWRVEMMPPAPGPPPSPMLPPFTVSLSPCEAITQGAFFCAGTR